MFDNTVNTVPSSSLWCILQLSQSVCYMTVIVVSMCSVLWMDLPDKIYGEIASLGETRSWHQYMHCNLISWESANFSMLSLILGCIRHPITDLMFEVLGSASQWLFASQYLLIFQNCVKLHTNTKYIRCQCKTMVRTVCAQSLHILS